MTYKEAMELAEKYQKEIVNPAIEELKKMIKETKKMKKFYCPVNGWDCPYWKKDGTCGMVDEGYDPVKECDDAAFFWDEDDDYFVDEE